MDEEALARAVEEFGVDSCSCCLRPHVRKPRVKHGMVLSVRGEPVCSMRCAVHLLMPELKRTH